MGRKQQSKQKKTKYHCSITGMIFLFLAMLLRQQPVCVEAAEAAAEYQEGTVSITAEFLAGADTEPQVLRAGRSFSMRVTIETQNTDFSGSLQVLQQNREENSICYTRDITVLENASITCLFDLPMNMMTEGIRLTLQTAGETSLIKIQMPFTVINYGTNLVIGIASEEDNKSSEYGYFSAFGSALTEISYEDFQTGTKALDSLDVIVADTVWLDGMPEEAADCLQKWVAQGRTLITGTTADTESVTAKLNFGLQDTKILQELISAISSYEKERNISLERNHELHRIYGNQARLCYAGDSILGPVLINMLSDEAVSFQVTAPAEPINKADILWQEGDNIVLWQETVQQGKLLHFNIPLTTKKSAVYPMAYYQLVHLVKENLPVNYENKLSGESYAVSADENTYLLNYVTAANENIEIMPYLLLLLVYILIVLPVVYLVLRKSGNSKYLWGAIPLLSVFFLLLVYNTGRDTRITKPYCSFVNIIDFTKEEQNGTLYFELSAPTNQGTQISLDTNAFVTYQTEKYLPFDAEMAEAVLPDENTLRSKECRVQIDNLENETKVSLKRTAAFSETALQAEYTQEQAGELLLEAVMTEDGMTGQLTNQTGLEFSQMYVYSDRNLLSAGKVTVEQEVKLEEAEQIYLTTADYWYEEEIVNGLFGINPYENNNSVILNLIYDYTEYGNQEGDYLFAVLEDNTQCNPLGETAVNPHSAGVSVMIFPIEVTEEEAGFIGRIDKYQCQPEYEDYMEPDQSYRRIYKEIYETEYDLSELEITAILYTTYRNYTLENNEYINYNEQIEFYNYQTGQYEQIWEGDGKANENSELTGEELISYLGEDGILKLRVVNRSGSACILPTISLRVAN